MFSSVSTSIEEFFLTFLRVDDKSGGLFSTIQDALVSFGLEIDDIRGQGYDNGSNMKGKNKGVAEEMDIEVGFSVKKEKDHQKKKKHFDEDPEKVDEKMELSPEDDFRINYFLPLMDQALVSLESRFEQFQKYEQNFGFLFDFKKLISTSDESLRASCLNLEASLKHGMQSDIDGEALFMELNILQGLLPDQVRKSIEVLDF